MSEMTVKFGGKEYVVIESRAPMKGDYFIALNLDNSVIGVLKSSNNWSLGKVGKVERLIVEPLVWKPQRGDTYYYPVCVTSKIGCRFWVGELKDEDLYKEGMVFQTEKEVEELLIKMKELVKDFRGDYLCLKD